MKRSIVKLILNVLVFSAGSFFIFFAAFYYFTPKTVAISLAVTCALLIALLTVGVSIFKEDKRKLKLEREKRVADLLNELCFMKKREVVDVFYNAYLALGASVEKITGGLRLKTENKAAFFCFSFDGLSKSDVLKAFNRLKQNETAVIYAYSADKETELFAARFDGRIAIESKTAPYDLLSKADALPKITHELLPTSYDKKVKLTAFLDRKKAVRFLALGLLFLFLSVFVTIKVYYIACGVTLCVLSLCVLFFVKPKTA